MGKYSPSGDTPRGGGGLFDTEEGAEPLALTPPSLLAAPRPDAAVVSGQVTDLADLPSFYVSDTGALDTEFAITHALGYIPRDAIGGVATVSGHLYRSATAWTINAAYLKFSGANAALWIYLR